MAEWTHYSDLDPEFAPLASAVPALPTHLSVEELKAALAPFSELGKKNLESHLPPSTLAHTSGLMSYD